MRRIPLRFDNCQVTGELVESADPRDLSEDMIEIELPNGVLIDAGWYPESSPQGRYRVVASLGLNVIGQPLYASTVKEAEEHIRRQVHFRAQPVSINLDPGPTATTAFSVSNSSGPPVGYRVNQSARITSGTQQGSHG